MKSTLNKQQQKFVDLMTDEVIYTNQQMADIIGVDVRTVYRWRRNSNITEAINEQADITLGQHINQANHTLMQVMTEGTEHAQLKAIDMLYKALGKYKEQTDITITEEQSIEEKRASLLSRLKG